MSSVDKVARWAGVLQVLTVIALIGLPAVTIFVLVAMPDLFEGKIDGISVARGTSPALWWSAIGLSLIRPLILLVVLNHMRLLFGHYRQRHILTDDCARLIKRIGQGFLAMAVVPFLVRPVISVLVTWANPEGQRSLAVGITSDMLFFALSGGLIIVIGWAMREASQVAAENRAFV